MDRCNGDESWAWLNEDFLLAKDGDLELWDNNATQEDDFPYIVEGSSGTPIRTCSGVPYDYNSRTPIRACSGVPYDYNDHHGGGSNKESHVRIESCPPTKRRRTLHFDNEDLDLTCHNEEFSFLTSKEKMDTMNIAASKLPVQDLMLDVEDISSSGIESLDQFEGWLTECFNDSDMQFSPDDMLSSGSSDGYCDSTLRTSHGSSSAPITQPNGGYARPAQQNIRPCGNIILKGSKSYMSTPTKLSSSVVYPFTFIKPSVANGDVTLTDINKRILTPPKAKEEISAITGKQVVTKTRIRTDGGRGSITIMRTKG